MLQSRLVFQSFSADSLRNFQKLAHTFRVYLLDEDMVKKTGFAGACRAGRAVWLWHRSRRVLRLSVAQSTAHARGLVVHPYTINLAAWQLRLARFLALMGCLPIAAELAVPLLGADLRSPSTRCGARPPLRRCLIRCLGTDRSAWGMESVTKRNRDGIGSVGGRWRAELA